MRRWLYLRHPSNRLKNTFLPVKLDFQQVLKRVVQTRRPMMAAGRFMPWAQFAFPFEGQDEALVPFERFFERFQPTILGDAKLGCDSRRDAPRASGILFRSF